MGLQLYERLVTMLKSYAPRAMLAVVVLLVGHLVARTVRWIVQRMLRRLAAEVQVFAGRLVYIAITIAALLWALAELNIYAAALTTLLGAITLAVTLSTQDLAKNFVAGVFLLVERPFRRGDRITIRTFSGQVSAIELRTTKLLAEEDRLVIVPNTIVMSEIVVKHPAAPETAKPDPSMNRNRPAAEQK
jgi:small-conductance mechanosensitive channel